MKIIFCSLVILLLVPCTKTTAEPVTFSFETPPFSPVPTTTQPVPSKTPSPTPPPTNTPVSLLAAYSLPSWMGNPNTNILAALVINEPEHTRKVSFFNATTGKTTRFFYRET